MSTANPQPQSSQPSLESEQRAHEPSMEEILASIRRIIADDDALPLMRRPSLVTRESAATPASPELDRLSDLPRHSAPPTPAPQVHLVAVPESSPPPAGESSEADAAPAEQTELSAGTVHPHSHDASGEGRGAQEPEYELPGPVRDEASREEGHGASLIAREHPDNERSRLVSPATDASVASSFQSLATS